MFLILRDNVSGKLQHTDVEGSKRGGVGFLITSSRTAILRFTSHKTNIYVFTLLKNRGYKMSNVTLAPICKTECFAYILRKHCAAINSLGKPAVGGSDRTDVWIYIERLESEVKSSHQMVVKAVWLNYMIFFCSIDLQCPRRNIRGLWQFRFHKVHFNRWFTEEFPSTSHISIHGHKRWLITASRQ